MKRYAEISELKISARRTVRPGSVVRLRTGKKSGPYFLGADGTKTVMTLPGTFEVVRILRSPNGQTVYLDVFGVDGTGGEYTVKVKGGTHTRLGIKWRPYSVELVRS